MATTRKTSGGAKKAAAKKGGAKKGGAKKSGAKAAKIGRAVQGKCSGWKAWHDFQPLGTPTLHVTGKCVFPTTGYKVKLVKAVPQGINPKILLLRKVVTPPTGIVLPVVTTVQVHYTLKTKTKYTHVTILPEVVTVKVKIVV